MQSRKRATYALRAGWCLAAILVFAFITLNFAEVAANGRHMFAVAHGCVAIMLFVLAPIGAADAISREKREGTLGLLLLTNLNPMQIVVGKLATHLIRLFYFALTTLPLMIIPMLMGGVEMRDFLFSISILLTIVATGVSGGLVASTLCVGFGAALFWAITFACVLTLAATSSAGCAVVALAGGFGFPIDLPLSFRIFGLGPVMMMFPIQVREMAGALGNAGPSSFVVAEIGPAALSISFLIFTLRFCARRIAAGFGVSGETTRKEEFRRKFLTPIIWRKTLRNAMTRALDRNPLIWLEYRTTWARTARWLMILIVLVVETYLVTSLSYRQEFLTAHAIMLWSFAIFLTFKSSSSFQNEKESGAFELLLVTPLTEAKLYAARLRAVASYNLFPLTLLIGLGLFGLSWAQSSAWEPDWQTAARHFTILGASIISVPIYGLFFALRCKTFMPAFFLTVAVALFMPFSLWAAFTGMTWLCVMRIQPPIPAALTLNDFLQTHLWPSIVAAALYHGVAATFCARGTIRFLRNREFATNG